MTPPLPPPVVPPVKKPTPVWVWILAGAAGLALLAVMAVVALGIFAVNKAVDYAKNPSQLVRMAIKANPDIELIDMDEDKKTIRIRDKNDNSEITLSFSDVMEGRVRITKEGKDGAAETVQIGGGKAQLPNWVPKFPGAEPQSIASAQGMRDGEGGVFTFQTSATAEKVRSFYVDGLAKHGLTPKGDLAGQGVILASEDETLSATITVAEAGGERHVTVIYGEKRAQSK